MGLQIVLNSLKSRTVRNAITATGIRTINTSGLTQNKDPDGNILSTLFSAAAKFGGFLVKKLFEFAGRLVQFSWTAIWGAIVSSVIFIYNFNWNVTDEELDKQISESWAAVGGALGGTVGNALGWFVGGVLPAGIIFTFNEALGAYLLKEVGEEALDEVLGNIGNVIRLSLATAAKAGFAYIFKLVRNHFFPNRNRNAKPWSIASAVEEKVESIDNKFWQQFVENFLEEFGEGVIEAGYVVAQGLDTFVASQKIGNQGAMGKVRTVEIDVNRRQANDG